MSAVYACTVLYYARVLYMHRLYHEGYTLKTLLIMGAFNCEFCEIQ